MTTVPSRTGSAKLMHCFLTLFLFLPCLHAAARNSPPQQLDSLVQQWLTLEQQHSQLQNDWQLRKQSLQQGISLLQAELKQLTQLQENNARQHDAVDEKRAALLAQQQQLEQQQQQAERYIDALLSQVSAMQAQLPPPLQQQWQQELASLADNAESSLKLQRSLGLLSKLAEFQQRLTLDEMTLTTDDGVQVRVRQLYLGVSQAWFSSADGSYAGLGFARATGWHWQFDHTLDGKQVLQAIAMVEKRAQAELIALPVHLATDTAEIQP